MKTRCVLPMVMLVVLVVGLGTLSCGDEFKLVVESLRWATRKAEARTEEEIEMPDQKVVGEQVFQLSKEGAYFRDMTGERKPIPLQDGPEGRLWAAIPHSASLNFTDAITVEALVDARSAAAEGMQALVSKWAPQKSFTHQQFDAYDATWTSGLNTAGFLGAVFDGRYVYFAPQDDSDTGPHDMQRRAGRVLRYDTHKPLKDPNAYDAYDAEQTAGLDCRGYYGACFDGRYVYFVPRQDGQKMHSRVLRYDTTGPFTDSQSWDAYDAGDPVSHQGVAFDGRYIYFSPGYEAPRRSNEPSGLVLRYDTVGDFHDPKSWAHYDAANTEGLDTANFDGAAFDGRYVYFIPLDAQGVLRYDTQAPFDDPANWAAHDVKQYGIYRCVGSVFDGRYLYLVPYGHTRVIVRYDTHSDFHDGKSWQAYDAACTDALYTIGYDGGGFDGRYVYFIPFWDDIGKWHCNFLRYDTQQAFDDPAAWRAINAGATDGLNTVGYNGGAFDGRYLYLAPWHDFEGYPGTLSGHGRVLRYDTLGNNGAFSLRWSDYGHNGGLCAAVPGPSFLVNTDKGVRSIAAHKIVPPGRHYLAGVYDGQSIKLFIDGELVAQREASGKIVTNDVPVTIGRIGEGLGYCDGVVQEVRISDRAKSVQEIRENPWLPLAR